MHVGLEARFGERKLKEAEMHWGRYFAFGAHHIMIKKVAKQG